MSDLHLKYEPLRTIKLSGDINTCNFSSCNTLAIGTSDKSVSVWEWTAQGYVEADYSPLLYHNYAVTSVVFSPDGQNLATSSADGMTYIFNSKTGSVRANIVQSLGGGVRDCALTEADKFRVFGTVTDEGFVFLWSGKNYQIQRYWMGHDACINTLAFSPDSHLLATGDSDGTFKLWLVNHCVSSIFTVDRLSCHVQRDAHNGGLLTITFSPNHYTELGNRDYQLCTGGDDDVIRLWLVSVESLPHGDRRLPHVSVQMLKVFEGHLSSITYVRFSPDSRYIGSTSLDSSSRLWKVSSGECVRVLGEHRHSVFCCAFSRELDFFATGSNDKTLNVWNITDKPLPPVAELPDCPDDDYEQIMLERRNFQIMEILKVGACVNSIDFGVNYDLAVGTSDKLIRGYTRTGDGFKEVESSPMKGHKYSVLSVEFSPCGQYVVTSSLDGATVVWEGVSGKMVYKPFQCAEGGRATRFSPSSEHLAIGGTDGRAHLWSLKTQQVSFTYPGHVESINVVSFTPDGKYLATGCSAGRLKLWKCQPACTICQVLVENVHDLGITSCDFSHRFSTKRDTGSKVYRLATGGTDSIIRVYKMWLVDELMVKTEEILVLKGHGGTITEVRFANKTSDVIASTSIDRTARIWNMQSGECLNVLTHHRGQVTCCAFSPDSTLFATGSFDSTVAIWKVPKSIILHNNFDNIEVKPKRIANPGESLDIDALRMDDVSLSIEDLLSVFKINSVVVPEHMVCPVTQQIMVDPVICEDGFTYEKHAIQAWMQNGRGTSPMTNVPFTSLLVVPNYTVRAEIKAFLLKHYKADRELN